jgi:fluoride exporter
VSYVSDDGKSTSPLSLDELHRATFSRPEDRSVTKYFLVLIGGGAGSLLRFIAGSAIMSRVGGRFPLGTLAINVSGSFLIGFLMTMLTERLPVDTNWRFLLVAGFLGGYTTFSAFEWETFASIRDGAQWAGLLNVLLSVGLGYLAVWLGASLARR